MRKFLAVVVLLLVVVPSAYAEDAFDKQVNIGRDRSGMTWWLVDYGMNGSTPYAVARKYYTGEAGRTETVEILTSRYSVKPKRANALYFTEYRYEYTADNERVAEAYRKHYDMNGKLIMGLEFDGRSSSTERTYVNVMKNTIQSKGLAYATGKLRKK